MGGFFDDVNDSLEEQAAGAATRLKYVLRENGETARELLHLPDAAAQRAAENLRAKYEAIKQDPHSDEHEEVEEGAVIIAMHTRRWLSGTYRRRRQLIVLQLSVAKAAGVENCRQLGLPDPYCRINLEGRYASLARETRVGWRKSEDKGEGEAKREYGKTLDPLWGEQFILMVQYEGRARAQAPTPRQGVGARRHSDGPRPRPDPADRDRPPPRQAHRVRGAPPRRRRPLQVRPRALRRRRLRRRLPAPSRGRLN